MNRLFEIRKEKQLNMSEMARLLGIPYTTYVGYEKEERHMYPETLKNISGKLGISIDYLLGRTDEKMPTTPKDGEREEEYEEFYYSVFSKLSPENLAFLKAQGQFLLDHQISQDGQG